MLQNQQNPQLSCNQKDHQNQIISAICTRKECEQQSAICQRCLVISHKLCVDQVIFVDDLPLKISKMEYETDLINQIFESLIQKLVKLQKQHQLRLNYIRKYKEIPNITNLNNVGSMLRTTNVDLEKILQGNELISQFIENYLNPEKPKELSQKQIEEAKSINAEGDVRYNKGKYNEAIEYYDRALSINPFSDLYWNNKGSALNELNKYQEAIQCLDQALKINPNLDTAWNNKGLALYKLNKYQEAIQCLDQALKINPNSDTAWNNKGLALDELNKYQEAIQCYDKSINIKPTALRYHNKSFPLENLNQLKEAEVCLIKALELDPNYALAKNRLNTIKEKQKK